MEEETALSRSEQEGARRKLKKLGVLQEKLAGVPAKLHYRVDQARFVQLVDQFYREQDCAEPAICDAENEQSITENTQGTTPETTHSPPVGGGAGEGAPPPTVVHDLDDVVFQLGDTGVRKDDLEAQCGHCGAGHTQETVLCECGAPVVWKHSRVWKKLHGDPAAFLRRIEEPDLAPKTPLEVKAVKAFGSRRWFAHITQARRFRTLARMYPEGYLEELIAWGRDKGFPQFEAAVRNPDNQKRWEARRESVDDRPNDQDEDPDEGWADPWNA